MSDPGHSSYYHDPDAVPLTPDQIRASVWLSDYEGYRMEEWARIRAMPDGPRRAAALAEARRCAERDLERDLARYAEVCRELAAFHLFIGPHDPHGIEMMYRDPRTAAWLKHNHLYNAYANLRSIERLEQAAGTQMEMF